MDPRGGKGPQEVPNPTSRSRQGQLRPFAQGFTQLGLENLQGCALLRAEKISLKSQLNYQWWR